MSAPLPPGQFGLPLVGETLTFLRDGFGFVESRAQRHGPIFRTHILGRKTAVVTGPDASGLFIDAERVQRAGAMPPHIQTLFAGQSLPLLDGDVHRERKAYVMAAFTRDALESYLPILQSTARSYLARWVGGRRPLFAELKRLAIESVSASIFGLGAGPRLDRLLADYELVGGGFASLPIPLPGSAFDKAKKALGRILDLYGELIREHQAQPTKDGLSRILAAKNERGEPMTVEACKMELHHIVVAGLILWAWFATALKELSKDREVAARLEAEIRGAGPLTSIAAIDALPELGRVSMEIRRVSPVVHVFFGKARTNFEFKGHSVPAGWMVLWGHRSSHLRPEIYADPERFDPSRFAPGRAEHERHPHAFVPNGAGAPTGHKCAGHELAPLVLKVFLLELLGRHRFELADPGVGYDWSRLPPEPKGGLPVELSVG